MWKIQEDKRIIEFEIAGYNSQIFISVRNSYDMESIINQKQKFITTKEDKLNHGIGLENVSRTVKKIWWRYENISGNKYNLKKHGQK